VKSFRSNTKFDENGEGLIMPGYSRVVLKVTHSGKVRNDMRQIVSDAGDFVMFHSGGGMVKSFFATVFNAIQPGNFPYGMAVGFDVNKAQNGATLLLPFDPAPYMNIKKGE